MEIHRESRRSRAELGSARSRRGFTGALADLERMLRIVPEYPGTFFTDAGYDGLAALTDRAVELIERRLEARTDRPAVEQGLAATIYRLRAAMESIYVGLHHDAAGNPSRNGRGTALVSPSR